MAKANLTVQLDTEVIRRARIVAAKRGTSLSTLVARELGLLVDRDERYEDARRRALEVLAKTRRGGGRTWTRDDIYADDSTVRSLRASPSSTRTSSCTRMTRVSRSNNQSPARCSKGLWDSGRGALSTQVLQEFYWVATSKVKTPMSAADAREIVSLYSTWSLVVIEPSVILNASRTPEEGQLSFSDALIVEAAKAAGARRLLTEDFAGEEVDGILIENPFGRASRSRNNCPNGHRSGCCRRDPTTYASQIRGACDSVVQ